MTPEKRRARAYAAKALIEDQTMIDGLNEIEADLHRQWESSGYFARRKRERLWLELKTVRALRQKLASFAGHA